ncbi:MAG TPA: hypothetical protein VES42_20060 [Pilimelia sp.]|nr:hypothetical protein [Pilimelia sp.]
MSHSHSTATGRPRRRTTLLALSAALCGLMGAGISGPAAADDKPVGPTRAVAPDGAVPAGFASWRDLLTAQNTLQGAAAQLNQAVRGRPGFAGLDLAVQDRQVRLYWHGAVPADVNSAVTAVRGRASVAVKPARHSYQQLAAAAARLTRRSADTALVVRVAIPPDGRGVQVGVRGSAASSRDRLAAVAQVPLEVAGGEQIQPLYSRVDDVPPFWGGARIVNARTGGQCSTGFAIANRSTGARSMLTAGHCGENGDRFDTGTRRYVVGYGTDKAAQADTLRIPTSAAGRTYDGGVGVNEFSKPVAGAWDSWNGLWVCTSGSFSGARCNIQIKGQNEWVQTSSGWFFPMTRAERVDYQSAAGQGDSGGPVFALTADYSKVIAVGTISAGAVGSAPAACTGVQGRLCSWKIWFADVADSLNRYNSSIVLG